jgi:hypothetical protein
MNTTIEPIPDLFTERRPTVLEVAGGEFLDVCRRQRMQELTMTSVHVIGLGRYRVSVRYNTPMDKWNE